MLDTAVLPVFVRSAYLPPLSLVFPAAIGMVAGPIPGLMSGVVTGFLSDVSAGALGDLLLAAMAIGALSGVLARRRAEIRSQRITARIFRVLRALAIFLAAEGAVLFYQYYQVDLFEWSYVTTMLWRVGLETLLAFLLTPLCAVTIYGTWRSNKKQQKKSAGEEKTF